MTKKAEIKKIVLDLDGVEVNLDIKQAKMLHKLLAEMFDKEIINIPVSYPICPQRWFEVPCSPYWGYTEYSWKSSAGSQVVYCSDNNTINCSLQSEN